MYCICLGSGFSYIPRIFLPFIRVIPDDLLKFILGVTLSSWIISPILRFITVVVYDHSYPPLVLRVCDNLLYLFHIGETFSNRQRILPCVCKRCVESLGWRPINGLSLLLYEYVFVQVFINLVEISVDGFTLCRTYRLSTYLYVFL